MNAATPVAVAPPPDAAEAAGRPGASAELRAFVARLHFYVGVLVGPFLLVAAVTGVLYALTPQVEDALYRRALRTEATGPVQSLAAQAGAARAAAGPGATLFAVRPATEPGATARVMFSVPGLGDSESRVLFVDPATLEVRGDLVAYGTSGILPFRIALDYLHRNLMLGEPGRLYSELAASWLWVLALGGVLLWAWRRTGRLARQNPRNAGLRTRRWHGLLGVTVSLGLLFLSATGLTWSQWAGGRIDGLRGALGWVTPSVSLALGEVSPAAAPHDAGHDGHDGHRHGDDGPATPGGNLAAADPVAGLDAVLAVARDAGIDSAMVELRLPRPGRAWLVREYDRSWPTQVDALAIDPRTMQVTGRADFATFPLVAKLIRWGIDLHMGVLFGAANQAAVAAVGIGLIGTILYGYRLWWRHRPAPGALPRPLTQSWLRLRPSARAVSVVVAATLGWVLPMIGVSLAIFLIVDVARWRLARPGRLRIVPAE